jgi:hypothetical protein
MTCLVGVNTKTLIKDVTMNPVLTILQIAVLLTVLLAYGRQ